MVMRFVKLAELKARLNECLRRLRRDHSLTVLNRDRPVARIVSYTEGDQLLKIRPPLGRYATLQEVPLPPPLNLDTDIVDLLLAERQRER